MIFGDPTDFAIEAEVESDLAPPSAVWGRMRIWCRGTELGDIQESYCALFHAATTFEWLSAHSDELWDEALADLDDPAAYAYLDNAYYGDDGRTNEQVTADTRRYAKFNFITNWGEQFDGFKAFLMYPPAGPIRIVYRLPDNVTGSSAVTNAGFCSAAKDFSRWYHEQQERLNPLPGATGL